MVRRLLLSLVLLLLLLAAAGGWLAWQLNDVPSLEPWAHYELPPAAGPLGDGEVRVTFLGVSTLLIREAGSAIMLDGFFSRPGLLAVLLGGIEPDRERISAGLARAGAGELEAVIVVHSHYDHAMDAPEVARRSGALLVGSESTANVGRGWGLEEARIRVPRAGERMQLGSFAVTLIGSEHFPHGMAMGEIDAPLVPPARAFEYLEGGSYSVLVEHASGTLLVQGSAGWRDGALAGREADVVLLGIGGLGSKDDGYREGYWREVVGAVSPRMVIPIHWDDFTRSLAEPLRPMPRLQDDVELSMGFLAAKVGADSRLRLALLPPLRAVTLLPLVP